MSTALDAAEENFRALIRSKNDGIGPQPLLYVIRPRKV